MGWRGRRFALRGTAIAAAAVTVGCASRPGALFPVAENPLVWPEPPEPARLRHLGSLRTSADLRAARSAGQSFADALFGRKPPLELQTPYALCTDGGDRLFVTDTTAGVVHVLDLARRRWSTLVPDVPGQRFGQPVGVACDPGGRLYVADSADRCVYVFDDARLFTGAIGGDFLQRPCGLAFDPQGGTLLVVDAAAHQVVVLDPTGALVARHGARGDQPGQFNYPTNIALDSVGRVYVSDSLNFRVQQFDARFRPLRTIGSKGDMPGYFSQPKGLATDADDHLYVVDANFEAVQVFDAQGTLLLSFGEEGRDAGQFWLPAGIFIDRADNRLWIADAHNRRVQAFEYLPHGDEPEAGR